MSGAYLLLDSLQIQHLPTRLAQLAPDAPMHLLYLNTAYADLIDCSPILIPVVPESDLARTFAMTWRASAGLWLETDVDEYELLEHLRSLVHVQLDGGCSAFFRYVDPRIARLWLTGLTPAARDRVMGPIRCVQLPEVDGSELRITQQNPEQPSARYASTPWLHLSSEQLAHIVQAQREGFDHRLVEHGLRHFPDCFEGLDEPARRQWAMACRRSAERQGFSAEDEVMCWVALYARFGEAFPDGPEHGVYRKRLKEPGLLPEQRLSNLLTELSQHPLHHKERME
jgi:hypothetical protein